jgi:hypothetical protein
LIEDAEEGWRVRPQCHDEARASRPIRRFARSPEEIMTTRLLALLAAALFLQTGCGTLSGSPAVRLSEEGERIGMRWHASLSSPQALAGAVQMEGSAWMSPLEGGPGTEVSVDLHNATPGGEHPWEVTLGRCGSPEGTLGSRDDYPPLHIDNDGRASARATIAQGIATSGSYSVTVFASPRNRELMVACGNLAPPSG